MYVWAFLLLKEIHMTIENIMLVEMRLKDGVTDTPVRFTNAPFDVTSDGVTFNAAGDLLGIGDFENTYELITDGLELTLSGVNPYYQTIVNNKGFDNAPIDIWNAQLSPESNVVISKVFYHRGFAGTPVTKHNESDDTITIALQTRSAFKSLSRSALLMTTSIAHHQALTADPAQVRPDDLFYQYSADVALGEETWKT
jgi:hypothetical protein